MLAAPAAPHVAVQVRIIAPGPDTTLVRPCAEGQAPRRAKSGGGAESGVPDAGVLCLPQATAAQGASAAKEVPSVVVMPPEAAAAAQGAASVVKAKKKGPPSETGNRHGAHHRHV